MIMSELREYDTKLKAIDVLIEKLKDYLDLYKNRIKTCNLFRSIDREVEISFKSAVCLRNQQALQRPNKRSENW